MNKVYICSSLRPEVINYVNKTLYKLPRSIHLRPWSSPDSSKVGHVETDVAMIQYCDELWVVGEYGRDCSWEIGYAMGLGKRVVIWRDDSNKHLIAQDWMYIHGITKGNAEVRDVPKYKEESV